MHRHTFMRAIGAAGITAVGGGYHLVRGADAQSQQKAKKAGDTVRRKLGTDKLGDPQEEDLYEKIIKSLKQQRKKLKQQDHGDVFFWKKQTDGQIQKVTKLIHIFTLALFAVKSTNIGSPGGRLCQNFWRNYKIELVADQVIDTFADWTFVLGYIPVGHIDDAGTLWTLYNLFEWMKDVNETEANKIKNSDTWKKLQNKLQERTGKTNPTKEDVTNAFPSIADEGATPAVPGVSTAGYTPEEACGPTTMMHQIVLATMGQNVGSAIPSSARNLGVADERVNMHIGAAGNRFAEADVGGVKVTRGEVKAYKPGGYINPTLKVGLSAQTGRDILRASDPAAVAVEKYRTGRLKIKGIGLVGFIKYGTMTTVERYTRG